MVKTSKQSEGNTNPVVVLRDIQCSACPMESRLHTSMERKEITVELESQFTLSSFDISDCCFKTFIWVQFLQEDLQLK